MRIKLSKQNWRLVGQKMGWLKRAQIETGAGGVTSTGAAEAMGMGKDKITPESLKSNTGNVDEGMEYNESRFESRDKNIRRGQGLLTEVQVNVLKDIDEYISVLYQYINPKNWKSPTTSDAIYSWFGSIKDQSGNRSGPITSESVEDALKNWGDPTLESDIAKGRNKDYISDVYTSNYSQNWNSKRELYNNYTPAQLQRFEKGVAERLQKIESLKGLVRNAFRTFMADKPQMGNTGGLDFTGNVKL